MVFEENQKQNESYTFKDIFFQPNKSDFSLAMIKEVESHEYRSRWTLMIKGEFNNKHKNKDGKLKTTLSIWYFKHKIFPNGKLVKHKARLCPQGEMQQ